ncbi:G5 and 3D domain-containing protein [Desulfosporosinus fructosivorans]
MYSLPISTYSDYWRATKVWSSYLGGLAVFAAGTRYSVMDVPHIAATMQPTFQQTTQSLNTNELGTEVSFSNLSLRQRSSQGTVSRGVSTQSVISRSVSIQEDSSSGVTSQGISSQNVERISSKIEIVDKVIPFETQYVETDKLLPGKREIQEKGENGILRQVVKTFEVNGQISDQQVNSSIEFKSPKTEVIYQNSKPVPKKKVIIENPKPAAKKPLELAKMNVRLTLNVESTAYTYTGNKTATGVEPREGLIAVDPKVIAMGSKVYVEGYGYAIAADTGGAIRGNKIDVFFPTLRQCMDWGRKPVHIYVLEPN